MEQLYAALIGLGIILITAIGYIVKAYTEKVLCDLRQNTAITTETKEALSETVQRLAAARNTILGLREIIREREDRLAFLISRHPETEQTLHQYQDRRSNRATELDERNAERRIIAAIDNAVDDNK